MRPEQEPQPGRLIGMRILLVDDHVDTLRIASRLLHIEGAEVETAGDVSDAVALACARPFDALVCDLMLPDGSGADVVGAFRAAEALRTREGAPPVAIAVSGLSGPEERARILRMGFAEHLAKPIDFAELVLVLAGARGSCRSIPPHAVPHARPLTRMVTPAVPSSPLRPPM
jgi:CheY-like chemotaxis protein